jgi:hypothetical protein
MGSDDPDQRVEWTPVDGSYRLENRRRPTGADVRRRGEEAPAAAGRGIYDVDAMDPPVRDLDFVEVLVDVGRWPKGTEGTVIALGPTMALVEVVPEMELDETGLPVRQADGQPILDWFEYFLDVPYGDLRVIVADASRP